MKTDRPEHYDCFLDSVRLHMMLWRRETKLDNAHLAEKMGISERTVRQRFRHPDTMTLAELYGFCELFGKEPSEALHFIASEAKNDSEE
ncbi:MAG: helix-turn-helix transcriptional regulator [Oscillospiraceae bacterium]|nr:helix-turn-helix transcriptional regulator [Oscillospiraceae bacterium]